MSQELINKIKENLDFEQRELVWDLLSVIEHAAYDKGFKDALGTYSYQKDGVSYVGTMGTTLSNAIAKRRVAYNYRPESTVWEAKSD